MGASLYGQGKEVMGKHGDSDAVDVTILFLRHDHPAHTDIFCWRTSIPWPSLDPHLIVQYVYSKLFIHAPLSVSRIEIP